MLCEKIVVAAHDMLEALLGLEGLFGSKKFTYKLALDTTIVPPHNATNLIMNHQIDSCAGRNPAGMIK